MRPDRHCPPPAASAPPCAPDRRPRPPSPTAISDRRPRPPPPVNASAFAALPQEQDCLAPSWCLFAFRRLGHLPVDEMEFVGVRDVPMQWRQGWGKFDVRECWVESAGGEVATQDSHTSPTAARSPSRIHDPPAEENDDWPTWGMGILGVAQILAMYARTRCPPTSPTRATEASPSSSPTPRAAPRTAGARRCLSGGWGSFSVMGRSKALHARLGLDRGGLQRKSKGGTFLPRLALADKWAAHSRKDSFPAFRNEGYANCRNTVRVLSESSHLRSKRSGICRLRVEFGRNWAH